MTSVNSTYSLIFLTIGILRRVENDEHGEAIMEQYKKLAKLHAWQYPEDTEIKTGRDDR